MFNLLPDLSGITSGQNLQVREQGAGLQHTLVPALLLLSAKHDVVLQGGILDPGLLGHVGN